MYNNKIPKRGLYVSSIICSMSSMVFGLNLTLLGCIEDVFHRENTDEKISSSQLDDSQWAFVTSIFCLGAILSSFVSSYLNLKKKPSIIINNIFYMAGMGLLFFASGYMSIATSRFLVGIGIGFTCAYVPLYLEKISPLEIKGLVCSLHHLFIVLGVLLGQVLSFYFNSSSNWRTGVFLALSLVLFHTLSLFLIRDVDNSEQKHTFKHRKSMLSLLKSKRARVSIITAMVLHSAQQMSCVNGVLFYSNKLFEKTGNQRFHTIVLGLTFVVSTVASMLFVDKHGRKPLLLLSILLDAVALMFLSIVENVMIPTMMFVMGFSFGLGPIVWFISSETFPDEYKHAGTAFSTLINWTLTYLVSRYFPIIYEKWGNVCFSFYSFYLILAFIYVLGFFKETKGKVANFQELK